MGRGAFKRIAKFPRRLRSWRSSRMGTLISGHPWIRTAAIALRRFGEHKMAVYAGNFAYSGFLALMPVLLIILSLSGFIWSRDPGAMQRLVSYLSRSYPELRPLIEEAALGAQRLRGLLGLIGILGLAWGSSRLIYSLKVGFAAIWGYRPRPTLAGRLRSLPLLLLLTLAAVMAMAFSLLAATLLGRLLKNIGTAGSILLTLLGPFLSIAASAFVLALLYRWGPRTPPRLPEALKAALGASLLLEAVQFPLGLYFSSIRGDQVFLGTLGIAIGAIVWLYAMGLLVFLGAELAAAMQERIQELKDGEAENAH